MATQVLTEANPLADPNNAIELSNEVTCGCGTYAKECVANFNWVYDATADTVTVTGKSWVLSGDAISGANAVPTIQDQSAGSATQASAAGEAADIVVDVSGLAVEMWRVDYVITTDNGCTDTATLFIDATKGDQSGSFDPFDAQR